jgi:hypothetical protein
LFQGSEFFKVYSETQHSETRILGIVAKGDAYIKIEVVMLIAKSRITALGTWEFSLPQIKAYRVLTADVIFIFFFIF